MNKHIKVHLVGDLIKIDVLDGGEGKWIVIQSHTPKLILMGYGGRVAYNVDYEAHGDKLDVLVYRRENGAGINVEQIWQGAYGTALVPLLHNVLNSCIAKEEK